MNDLIVIALFVVFGIWLTGLTVLILRKIGFYEKITKRGTIQNPEELLERFETRIRKNESILDDLHKVITKLRRDGEQHIQKIGYVRFNPFADTGGKQSFVISLLDVHNNGIVITVLHGRGGSRWYTKVVEKGESRGIELSREEKLSIKKAGWASQMEKSEPYG